MAVSITPVINSLKLFYELMKLVRWFHELLAVLPFTGLYFAINFYAAKTGQSCDLSGFNFIVLCLGVQLLVSAGCILNDVMDHDIDKVNKPNTRVVGRTISLAAAKQLFILNTLFVVGISFYISVTIFVEWAYIALVVYLLSIAYDVYFKRSPLFGNILIALLASFVPLVIFFFAGDCIKAFPANRIEVLIYLYAAFPFFIIVARELSLDISDMEGDKADKCRTLPIIIGERKSKIIVASILLFIVLAFVLMSFIFSYLSVSFMTVAALLFIYLFFLSKAKTRLEYIKAGRFLWFIMIIGLVGFTFSTLYS